MNQDLDKAKILLKLLRKGNWNDSYDQSEYFKRFENLDGLIKELKTIGWVILHKKPKFEAYSLSTEHKKEIIDFIEALISEVQGTIR
ncbi:hypothetical protein COU57_02705 [Candidatus Pacearchaeota archaeon CG10_big_fil_rev_8_21_14_0_10_32_14]|nr:MAG: hypothetical protein COU57_02705 [Candidatus Pacearchaeota archaeon CG10_big_fil_rev_8_21_14_0_10_32_14]